MEVTEDKIHTISDGRRILDSETKRRLEGVAERLRELRRLKGWSQKDLSANAGVSTGTVAWLETQKHEPQPRTMRKIAAALGVEVADLYPEADFPKATAPQTPLTDLSRDAFDTYARNVGTEEEARRLRTEFGAEFDALRGWLKSPEGQSAPEGERLKARQKLDEAAARLNLVTLLEAEFITALDDKREAPESSRVQGRTPAEIEDRVAAEQRELKDAIATEAERQRIEEAGEAG